MTITVYDISGRELVRIITSDAESAVAELNERLIWQDGDRIEFKEA